MGGYISSFLCTIVATTYPVYASFKAIESENKDDDTAWLIYWVVYSAFALAEAFVDRVAFWVPFYYEAKLLILVLLQFPQLNLSVTIYNTYIRPFLKKNEKKIDQFVDDASKQVKKRVSESVTKAGPAVVSAVLNASAKKD